MKIYLGYSHDSIGELLKQAGAERVLYSYYYIKNKPPKYTFPDMFIDSGAYTAETKQKPIQLKDYMLWLRDFLPQYSEIKHYVNLDVLSDYKKTKDNQLEMEANGFKPMPVYHYKEPEEVLEYYCSRCEFVGLGGLAVGKMNTKKLTIFWEYVAQKYSETQFHILGVNVMRPFYRFQPYSIDSLSYLQYAMRFEMPGYNPQGMPDTYDISQKGMGWVFPIYWKDYTIISIKTVLDWEKLEWRDGINQRFLTKSPQQRLL